MNPPQPYPVLAPSQEQSLIARLLDDNERLRRKVAELSAYKHLAYRDPLTGLRNRRYCAERLAEELDRARRHRWARVSVLIIDLDDLKAINDEYGHHAGDQALQHVARWLEAGVRQHDAVCRTGGDEFTILLPNATETGRYAAVARLRQGIADGNRKSDLPFAIHVSVGGATYPVSGESAPDLLRIADAAMYRDKLRQKGAAKAIARIAGVA